jgi:hypothetical protein
MLLLPHLQQPQQHPARSASLFVPHLPAGAVAHAAAPAAPEAAAVADATAAMAATSINGTPPDSATQQSSSSSFVRFLSNGPQSGRLSLDGLGVERSELSSGISMLGSALPSFEMMQRIRKTLSPEELQAAFARR